MKATPVPPVSGPAIVAAGPSGRGFADVVVEAEPC
jgi:hypothetical protein